MEPAAPSLDIDPSKGPEGHEYKALHELKDDFYEQLRVIDCRVVRDQRALEVLEGKNVILIIGNTGAGKSTLVNAIVKGEDAIYEDEDTGRLLLTDPDDPIIVNGRVMFKIGHEANSCTETPGYCELPGKDGESVWLVDCPGLNDTNATKEYSNRTAVHSICQKAKTVKICVLMTGGMYEGNRGSDVVKMLTTLSRLLSDNGRYQLNHMFSPFLTKADMIKSPNVLKNKTNGILEVLTEKIRVLKKAILKGELTAKELDAKDQYSGDEFPRPGEELKFVKYILNESYGLMNYVHPCDDIPNKHKDKSLEVS